MWRWPGRPLIGFINPHDRRPEQKKKTEDRIMELALVESANKSTTTEFTRPKVTRRRVRVEKVLFAISVRQWTIPKRRDPMKQPGPRESDDSPVRWTRNRVDMEGTSLWMSLVVITDEVAATMAPLSSICRDLQTSRRVDDDDDEKWESGLIHLLTSARVFHIQHRPQRLERPKSSIVHVRSKF